MSDKKAERVRQMFESACAYSKAAMLLNNLALIVPSHVNAALALELFFKTLYFHERNEDFKNEKGRHSHDFHDLYRKLEDERKETIKSLFDQKLSTRGMSDVEAIERQTSMSVPRDLDGNLKMWKDVFVKFRYLYDSPQGQYISAFFFPEIEDSVVDVILKLRPDLALAPIYQARLAIQAHLAMGRVQIVPYL